MPRLRRSVPEGVAHHVTQRGVDRQDVFFDAADRQVYLSVLEDNLADAGVEVLAYCLMSNHVHWVMVPERPDSLAILFRRVHGRYAQYANARRRRSGHLWQNRYFSCAVEPAYLWSVLRYVEVNPVRARMVTNAGEYPWSSAAAHLAGPRETDARVTLAWEIWREAGGCAGWKALLEQRSTLEEVVELRRCTYAGKPFGGPNFLVEMEQRFTRQWREPGRPRKSPTSEKGDGALALCFRFVKRRKVRLSQFFETLGPDRTPQPGSRRRTV